MKKLLLLTFTVLITTSILLYVNFSGNSASHIGPGLGNKTYFESQLFENIAWFDGSNGAKKGHGNVSMINGYLFVPGGEDGGNKGGGFAFFDVSDPENPQLVNSKFDNETEPLREAHGFGFSRSYPGYYAALQTINGFMLWDFHDVKNPSLVADVNLSGVQESDYNNGAWWLSFQAPYVYVGGSSNGLYVVDVSDPSNPDVLNNVSKSQTGGFNVGPVFAIGNLLVIGPPEGDDFSVLDISDPANPKLLDHLNSGKEGYSIMVNGNKIYNAGTNDKVSIFDFSDPNNISFVAESNDVGSKGGYITYQDGFVFAGMSNQGIKLDVRDPNNMSMVGKEGNVGDNDFSSVLGNLMFIGNDHGEGSGWVPHQKEPDTKGPDITMISPKDSAVNQAVTSRIGVTMSDRIKLRSVDNTTFIVRNVNSGDTLKGKYSHQTNIVNFSPNNDLKANSTYEVIFPKNGVEDIVGNSIEKRHKFIFSTGDEIGKGIECKLNTGDPVPAGQEITFDADLISDGQGGITYNWQFGDGTDKTTSDSIVTHTYSEHGGYLVQLTIEDKNGNTHTCSDIQSVHKQLTNKAPLSSGPIIFDSARNKTFNVNPDNNSVTIINADTYTKSKEIAVGKKPRSLAKAPSGNIWVTNQEGASVSVIDPEAGSVKNTYDMPYGSQPFGIVFNPDGNAAYVTLQATGKVVALDPSDGTIMNSIDVGPWPRAIAMSGNGEKLLITRFISGSDHGVVSEIDVSSFTVDHQYNLAINPGPDTESSGRGLPNYLADIAISPSGDQAFIPAKQDNIERGLLKEGRKLTFETTVRPITAILDLDQKKELLDQRIDLDNRDSPSQVLFSKLGNVVFIANQGNNIVEVRNAYTGERYAAIENTSMAPQGLALSDDGNTLFVYTFTSRKVEVYDVEKIVNTNGNIANKLATIDLVNNEKLSDQVLQGKKIFYHAGSKMSRDGYFSCATCHISGKHDGRVRDFTQLGEGMRNTTSLKGVSGMDHGNVHWSGNFDEIQDFEEQIRTLQAGDGFMSDEAFNTGTRSEPLGDKKAGISEELDALAAFVNSLDEFSKSPHRKSDGSLTQKAMDGKAIFVDLECYNCHGGDDFTDSDSGLTHTVGTIKPASGGRLNKPLNGLDAPTLRGIWETAPYLHDGSAPTLRDVLTTNNVNDQHGNISSLSDSELDQLVAYLKQIDGNNPAAQAPKFLKLTSPDDGKQFKIGEKVSFEIQTDYGNITKVDYYANGHKVASSSVAPYQVEWQGQTGKEYKLRAKLFHNGGKMATISKPVNITYEAREEFYATTNAAIIDGNEEEMWAAVQKENVTNITRGNISSSGDLSGSFRALWDKDYLYIFARVQDEQLNNDSKEPWDDDGVQLFIDIGNDKKTSYGNDDYRFVFPFGDNQVHELKHDDTAGTQFSQTEFLGGYRMEIKIPWDSMGEPDPAEGTELGFDMQITDDDDGGKMDGAKTWHYDGSGNFSDTLAKVNFQPGSVTPPDGYMVDAGNQFGDRGNGFTYGWDQFNGETRNNNHSDVLYATLNHFEKGDPRTWEIEVPDGKYKVHLVCGDADNTDQKNDMLIEDTLKEDPNGMGNHFDEFTAEVIVTDGKLTIKPASSSDNAKINYVDIISLKSVTNSPSLLKTVTLKGDPDGNMNKFPDISLTAPDDNSIYQKGDTISIASDAVDEDGNIEKVEFYANNFLLGTANSSPFDFNWEKVNAGHYDLKAVAVDDSGARTWSSPVYVTIADDENKWPVVQITSPESPHSINSNETVTINTDAEDVDGQVDSVKFFIDGVSIGTSTEDPFSFTTDPLSDGEYELTAIAYDDKGASSQVSNTVKLNVGKVTGLASSNNHNKNSLICYPNPSDNYLNVKTDFSLNNSYISIVDMYGKVQYQTKVNSYKNKRRLNVSALSSGFYILKLEKNNQVFKKKINIK